MAQELYKRYRPHTLGHIVGNEETVHALKGMLSKKTLPHTLLFYGPSGCGKTTLARILAKELRCQETDLREVNSANFRGIDTVRDISQVMHLTPIGPYRVWIIDEAHKMTNDAQNAALKILEDTPEHVYFFLCTMEPQKLLKTVRNRCCEMPVRILRYKELEKIVQRVSRREEIDLSEETVSDLIVSSQGSPRVLLVLLDKIAGLSEPERKKAIADRLAEENKAIELCQALMKKAPWKKITSILKGLNEEPETIRWAIIGYARAVLLNNTQPDYQAYVVIDCFEQPFYDSKMAGLAKACFEVVFQSETQ